jgi:HlyD family secretion protein
MNAILRNKWTWISAGGLLLVILIFVIIPGRRTAAQEPLTGDIVTVRTGSLSASATASGRLQAQETAGLTLPTGGTVTEILVSVGDEVSAGDELLRVETDALERAVANAAAAVAIQEANLATLEAGSTAADILAAEAAVRSAEAALADLLDGPDPLAVESAQANVDAARADLFAAQSRLADINAAAGADAVAAAQIELDLAQKTATEAAQQHSTILVTESNQFLDSETLAELEESARLSAVQANANLLAAQEAYDQLVNGDPNSIAAASASVALAQASLESAEIQLAITQEGPSDVQIRQSEASLAQAEETLHRLQNPVSEAQLEIAASQLAQAEINLERAQLNLENATLTAPFDGVVTAVNVSAGEQAGGILVEIADLNTLEVALDVDEVDISQISIGQPAEITLESFRDTTIPAEVVSISPRSNPSTGGLVIYSVYLALGETDLPVLVDMTANANLITAEKDNVLLVPNRAITPDRAAGKYYVTLVNGEESEQIEVEIGLRDGDFTEIISGVQEGDELLIDSSLPTFDIGNSDGPPPFVEEGN